MKITKESVLMTCLVALLLLVIPLASGLADRRFHKVDGIVDGHQYVIISNYQVLGQTDGVYFLRTSGIQMRPTSIAKMIFLPITVCGP